MGVLCLNFSIFLGGGAICPQGCRNRPDIFWYRGWQGRGWAGGGCPIRKVNCQEAKGLPLIQGRRQFWQHFGTAGWREEGRFYAWTKLHEDFSRWRSSWIWRVLQGWFFPRRLLSYSFERGISERNLCWFGKVRWEWQRNDGSCGIVHSKVRLFLGYCQEQCSKYCTIWCWIICCSSFAIRSNYPK